MIGDINDTMMQDIRHAELMGRMEQREEGDKKREAARDQGVPCSRRSCQFWAGDPSTQNCIGETKSGGPAIELCKNYTPATSWKEE